MGKISRPIYLIKSQTGEVLIQGSAEQVKVWLEEKRITDSSEISREGWKLYENDEAWATIVAFPEIHGPSGWDLLKRLRKRTQILFISAIAVMSIGLTLITLSHLLPAIDVATKIANSTDAERKALNDADFAKKELSALKSVLNDELQREGELNANNNALLNTITRLERQIDVSQNTLPIFVRWRDSAIGSHKVMVFSNTSSMPLKLLISVYDSNNVQTTEQYVTSLEPISLPMSVKESGNNEKVNHHFKIGEYAEFTDVDTGKVFRYYPVKFRCE